MNDYIGEYIGLGNSADPEDFNAPDVRPADVHGGPDVSEQKKSCWNCRFALGSRAALYCMIAENPVPTTGGACRNWGKILTRDPGTCYWSESVQDMQANYTCCRLREKHGDLDPVGWEDCDACPEYHDKNKKTKGDELREMSDTELTAFMMSEARGCPPVQSQREKCIAFFIKTGRHNQDKEVCEKCWGDWLRKEAEA